MSGASHHRNTQKILLSRLCTCCKSISCLAFYFTMQKMSCQPDQHIRVMVGLAHARPTATLAWCEGAWAGASRCKRHEDDVLASPQPLEWKHFKWIWLQQVGFECPHCCWVSPPLNLHSQNAKVAFIGYPHLPNILGQKAKATTKVILRVTNKFSSFSNFDPMNLNKT